MKCPYCNCTETKVIDSRTMDENTAIRRRRQCEKCNERFTTYERIDVIPLTVLKRNGKRESFDEGKLLNGLLKSCNKRMVSIEQVEGIVKKIEDIVLNSPNKEIESKAIGEISMEELKKIDEVAYVRFASVYKQFDNIDTFMEELSYLKSDKSK